MDLAWTHLEPSYPCFPGKIPKVSLRHTSSESVGSGEGHRYPPEVSTDHRNGIGLSQRAILSKMDALCSGEIEFGLNEKKRARLRINEES